MLLNHPLRFWWAATTMRDEKPGKCLREVFASIQGEGLYVGEAQTFD